MMKKYWSGMIMAILLFAAVSCAPKQVKKACTITYMNGETVFSTEDFREGETVNFSLLTFLQGNPVKAEDDSFTYTFSGWAESEGGEKLGAVTIAGDMTVYALFDAHEKQQPSEDEGLLTVTFVGRDDSGETTISTQKVKAGELALSPEEIPAPTGYRFTGWDRDLSQPITARTQFSATYEKCSYRLVRHILGETTEEEILFEETLDFVDPVPQEALLFEGWYMEREYQTPVTETTMPAGDLHIYAKYSVDFTSAHLSFPELVYGGENIVSVEGLKTSDLISYTFLWQDGSRDRSLRLDSAGEKNLSVKITGEIGEGDASSECTLERTVIVAKKPLKINLSAEDITYGEAPFVTAEYDGLVRDADVSEIVLSYVYFDESETQQTSFPAGRYRVEGRAESQNYEIIEINYAEFTVNKKALTVTAQAENCTYGTVPSITFSYEGFADGEGEEVVTVGENAESILKGESICSKERLCAGDYALSARIEAFSAQNYEFVAGEPTQFTVERAPLNVEIVMEKTTLVYGERPQCSIRRDAFCYADETEQEVFGGALEIVYTGENQFHVGSFEANIQILQESENYEIVTSPVPFTVERRQVSVTLPAVQTTFGEDFNFPSPVIEGLIGGEEELIEEIKASLTTEIFSGEEAVKISEFLRAGEYAVRLTFEGELPDYTITCGEGSLRVDRRPFAISSGEVSQNRNTQWSYAPEFPTELAEKFQAEGLLVLTTTDAGTYTAEREEDLFINHFIWQTPLKFMLTDGTDVTDCFAVTYDLHITLNNSTFAVTLPFSQKTIPYDNAEHEFPVTVKTDQDLNDSYTVRYKVNDSLVDIPKVKDAGEYLIECEISAQNYDTETRTYQVTVEKANYTFAGSTEGGEFSYDGSAKAQIPSLSGVGGENVSGNLGVLVEYTPVIGEKVTEAQWLSPVNAGEYSITLTAAGNANYNDASKTYTVKINRIHYTVQSPDQTYTYDPNTSFGEGITVHAVDGNPTAVEYDYNGNKSADAPKFREAIPDGATISYLVAACNNYEEVTGEYHVTIHKRKGELNVTGIKKYYEYSGEEQIIDTGATTNNTEDGVIVYEDNRFTSVKQGNALTVTVRLKEGKNYTGAVEKVTGFQVVKKTFQSLPIDKPAMGEQYNMAGKRLSDVMAPAGFYWKNDSEALTLGEKAYAAIYNPDRENCNDFETTLSFTTRKEKVNVKFSGGEGEIGGSDFVLADYTLTGEDGRTLEKDEQLLTFQAKGNVNNENGGTYPVTCELTLKDNNYFEIENDVSAVVPFKLKSAKFDSKLYTVEDALHLADSGIITLMKNTALLSKEDREKLTENPYPDDSYYKIKSGVTLLVPYKADDSGTTTQKSRQEQTAVSGEGYCRLTIPSDVELVTEGKLIVNALRSSEGQRTSMVVGTNFATLELKEGAQVRVKSGGVFESMGFTFGEGEIVAESGGKIYEPFAMVGWKGGSISAAIRNNVFPINQYTLSSLESKTRFETGSQYVLRASLSATLSITGEQNLDLEIVFLGGSDAFLELKSGEITKQLDGNKKVLFEVLGEMTFHNLELKLSNTIKFNTSKIQVPIPGNVKIDLKQGSVSSIPNDVALKFLPGAEATVEREAILKIEESGALLSYGANNVKFETVSEWQDGGNKMTYPHTSLPQAYRGGAKFDYTAKTPATIRVLGTLDAKSGSTLAAEIVTEDEGNVTNGGADTEKTLEEDLTPAITELMDKLGALSGKGGTFFQATLKGSVDGQPIDMG